MPGTPPIPAYTEDSSGIAWHTRRCFAQITRAWGWLVKPCRSDAQALEHEGNRDATGAEVSLGVQERAMPEPQPQQAKRAVGASVFPPLAHIGLARLKSGDASGRRAGVLLRRSSTKGTATPVVRRSGGAPWSVQCRSRFCEPLRYTPTRLLAHLPYTRRQMEP